MTPLIFQFQYQLIAQQIRERILHGELSPGMRLESERVLCAKFQVQRNTIRQALDLLAREGYISIEGRRGSFVLQRLKVTGGTFLVSMPSGSAPNVSALVESFKAAAEEKGFEVRRSSNDPLPDSNLNQVPDTGSFNGDFAGLLIWPHFPIDAKRIKAISQQAPVVLVDQRIMGVSTDSVRCDDVAGGKMVTEHLLELGHRRIAFLTDEVFAETVQSRWQGYALAHEEAGIICDPRLSLLYQFISAEIFELTMRRLWEEPEVRPTAIVCSNDVVAFLLLRYLHNEGIRVPEDIAVTGYGNSMPDYTAAVSLTTVDQPFSDVGREAARLLCDRTRQTPSEWLRSPQDIVLPVRLVVRGSTASATEPERNRKRRLSRA